MNNRSTGAYVSTNMYQDADGNLHMWIGERLFSGIETLEPGSGLTALVAGVNGDVTAVAALPSTEADDPFDPDGHLELVAYVEAHNEDETIYVCANACKGPARRLFGLPS